MQLYRPSPLQRATTAAGSAWPDRAALNFSQLKQQRAVVHSPATTSASSHGAKWSWGTSHLSQVSTQSSLDAQDQAPEDSRMQDPPLNTPRSRFSNNNNNNNNNNNKALPTYPSIVEDEGRFSNAPRPSKAAPPMQESAEKVMNAAEIFIARQVSISRQQQQQEQQQQQQQQQRRRLLNNIVPKTARQPMQPVLVDVRSGHMGRNSHHVLLEEV
ncbi:hypothetical protein MMC08_000616 [Hypocenomyce scalaris]|nr:hypothetical protein [Hypocenomyce scalaris]